MPTTPRMQKVLAAHRPLMDFAINSEWARRGRHKDVFDFTFGNPQEMPIPGFADALQRWAVPHNKDWYAYRLFRITLSAIRERLQQSLQAFKRARDEVV